MKISEADIQTELRRINLSRNRYAYVLQLLILVFSVWYQTRFQGPLSPFILALGFSGCLFRVFATEIIYDDIKASNVFLWLGFFLLSAAWVIHIDQALRIYGHHGETIPTLRVTVGALILANNALLVADLVSYYIFIVPIGLGLAYQVFFQDMFHHQYPLGSFLVIAMLSSLGLHHQHKQLRLYISARLDALREKTRLRYLINSVPGYVAMISPEGIYFDANEEVKKFYPDIVGRRVGTLLEGEGYTMELLKFLHSKKEQETVEASAVIDGNEFHFMSTFGRLEDGGAISISIPIGELVKARKELQEKEAVAQFSSKLASIGQMAAGVAHEVNNPLAIIQGSASIIAGLVDEEEIDKKNLKVFSEKIVTTSDRIAQIVRSLRSLSRGGEQDPFAPLSIKNVLTSCLDISHHNLKQLDIQVHLPEGKKDFMVMGREVQLGQVILNLLSNAIDAVKGLKEKWIRIDYGHTDGQAWIEIIDSGTGIPDEISMKIMEPFFTTKVKEEGTGLGLSISSRIIIEHGGKLTYEKGRPNTTFRIVFPSPKVLNTQSE
ncbi:MAG: ATP-binding protein [Bdellovibrionota bacterium]